MKRKVTQIGKFLLAASLMLGSASWANAEKQTAPAVGKRPLKEVKVWDLTDWNADTLLIQSSGTTEWSRTINGGVRFECKNDVRNAAGELLVKANGDVLPATKGLTWASDEGSKKTWNCTMRAKMDNGENMLQCGRRPQIGFVKTNEYPKVGQVIEITFNSLGTKNVGRGIDISKSKDVRPLFSTATKDSLWCGTSTETTRTCRFAVTGENPKFYGAVGAIGVIKIVIYEPDEANLEAAKIGYVRSPENTENYYEPVYDALQKIKGKEGNKIEIETIDATPDTELSADLAGKYDVLVVGSLITGDDKPFYASLDALIGKVPVLNTKAFWHGKKRLKWANDNGGNPDSKSSDTTYQVTPPVQYKGHPVFAGLVDPESFDTEKIDMFNRADIVASKKYNAIQGVPASIVSNRPDSVPVHTTIGYGVSITDKNINSIAESWSREKPYMLIGINSADLSAANKPALTDDGVQVIANAVNYLVNATQPAAATLMGTCGDPKITFEKVKADGTTDSDTLRYVLRIEVAKQHDVTQNKDTFPTVTVTIGSLAAKTYDFAHPDTLWEPCTVKAKATALLYNDSEEVSAEFTNPGLRKLDAPEAVFTKQGETVSYVLTFKDIQAKLDGVDTTAVIKYNLDGSDNLTRTYDKNHPDTVWENTHVKAQASLYLHLSSAKLDSTWKNPDVQPAAKPVITSAQNENYPGGCVMTVTITSATEGADIYYTFDGSEANRNSYHYTAPFDVENFEDVTIKAIAVKEYFSDSETAETVIPANTTAAALATPVVAISDNSFTITCEATGKYDIIYTVDGSEPSTENGLIYTDKVTYLKGDYTIKAIAQGYGYKASAVSEGKEFKPADDKDHVFLKTMYQSTFNLNDPSAVKDPSGAYTWGWFRWTPDGAPDSDNPWVKGGKHTEIDRTNVANKYITDEEWNDGVYYDSEKKPRVQIFENNAEDGWRHFNNWVFWKDGRKDGNYRRILIQEGMNAKLSGALVDADSNYVASGGAIYIFNATPKAAVGPDSLLQGPFAVVVNIASGNNGAAYSDAATMNVCLTSNSTGAAEMKIGEVSCVAGKMGTDTIYYYGDQKVYVRLTTESKIVLVYDFIAYKEGIDLPPLAVDSITPAGGASEAEAIEMDAADLNTFRVYFNHDIQPGAGRVQWTNGPDRVNCETAVSGNVLTVTLPADAPKEAGLTYGLFLQPTCVIDADGQNIEGTYYYYTIKGTDAIDEVSAAKEVVATHIYSISGAEIPALRPGINFVKKIYSDGSVTTEKVQVK